MNRVLQPVGQFMMACCLLVAIALPAAAKDDGSGVTVPDSVVRAPVTAPASGGRDDLSQVPASRPNSAENATGNVSDERATRVSGSVGETTANAVAVGIAHQGHDPVGKALALSLKERLVRSPLFRLSTGDERKIILRLVTHPVFADHPRLFSAYSLTWTLFEGPDTLSYFLRQDGGVLDGTQPEELASALVGQTDKVAADAAYLFE